MLSFAVLGYQFIIILSLMVAKFFDMIDVVEYNISKVVLIFWTGFTIFNLTCLSPLFILQFATLYLSYLILQWMEKGIRCFEFFICKVPIIETIVVYIILGIFFILLAILVIGGLVLVIFFPPNIAVLIVLYIVWENIKEFLKK